MRKFTLLLSLMIAITFASKAQTTYMLQEDFSTITTGDNASTSGPSSSLWSGNTNFPTITTAYPAGGAVKIGAKSATGSITSKILDLSVNGGRFNISFDVKGWTTVEGSVSVTVTGLTPQTVTYLATIDSSFVNKVLTFTGGTANSTITIATTAKRAFIDNVNIYYSIFCNPSNLTFSNSSVSKIIGATTFTQTATSLNTDPITYSSSATSVATVNPTTGEVTPLTIGTTTITATQAASNGYCASTATYTLNVTAAPTLTLTDVTNPTLVSTDGSQITQTINVSAVNLTTDLGLAVSGPNADLFTLSQYAVTQTGGNVPNTAITITYKPVTGTNHSAILTMASTGAFDLARPISGVNNGSTGVNSVLSGLNVSVYNGKINVTANAGQSLDIYNSVGQRLMHSITTEGLNSITVSANGVLLVKLGNQVTKVIL